MSFSAYFKPALGAALALGLGVAGLALAAHSTQPSEAAPVAPESEPVPLRLGYFANVTHATALVGVERGLFKEALGQRAALQTLTFNAGPAAIESLLSGALDITYIGPNPAINAFVKSKGKAVRVVCGATSGGAFLIVDPSIAGPADLKGKQLATPQLGNTQDVALRAWLRSQGLRAELTGASDVQIVPQENAQTLEQFRQHHIAGAWVPEPWATRLLLEGGGKVLVDERELWPDGRYVTTHVLVRTEFLEAHPELVKDVLRAHLEAEAWIAAQPAEARETVNAGIAKITGKRIGDATLAGAWKNLVFTHDPVASSLVKSAKDAQEAGLLKLEGVELGGIYDLRLLDELLGEAGLPKLGRGAAK